MSASKTVCSWDVGIKNLAYCVIERNETTYLIKDWGIINLVKDEIHYCKSNCKAKKNKVKVCNKRAKYYGHNDTTTDDKVYYCGMHKKHYTPPTTISQAFTPLTQRATCDHFLKKKQQTCNKNAHTKYNTLSLCNTHKKQYIKNFTKKYSIHITKKKKPLPNAIFKFNVTLINKLNEIKSLLNVDEVLIENQPALKNPKMKSIAIMLFSYFVNKGIIEKDTTKSPITNVRMISPSNKLKVNEDKTLEVLKRARDTNNAREEYKLTKELAIKYTRILLNNGDGDQHWINFLDQYKKKDDLCDAFLQGYHYLYLR